MNLFGNISNNRMKVKPQDDRQQYLKMNKKKKRQKNEESTAET